MKYRIVKRKSRYCILEIKTDYVIICFEDKEDARKCQNNLNYGGGFDGWTPEFMSLKELKYKYT